MKGPKNEMMEDNIIESIINWKSVNIKCFHWRIIIRFGECDKKLGERKEKRRNIGGNIRIKQLRKEGRSNRKTKE